MQQGVLEAVENLKQSGSAAVHDTGLLKHLELLGGLFQRNLHPLEQTRHVSLERV